MDLLICEKAYRTEKRGKIYCTESKMPCAHSYYCAPAARYKQFDSAKDCPGRENDGKNVNP